MGGDAGDINDDKSCSIYMFVLLRVFVLCGVFDVIVKQLFEFRGILEILLCACTSIWCGWYLVFKLIELCTCNASSHTCAHTHTHTHTPSLFIVLTCTFGWLQGCICRDAPKVFKYTLLIGLRKKK